MDQDWGRAQALVLLGKMSRWLEDEDPPRCRLSRSSSVGRIPVSRLLIQGQTRSSLMAASVWPPFQPKEGTSRPWAWSAVGWALETVAPGMRAWTPRLSRPQAPPMTRTGSSPTEWRLPSLYSERPSMQERSSRVSPEASVLEL